MRVLVAGDVVTDHYIYEGQELRAGSTVREGAKWVSEPGGAGLVGRLLETAGALKPDGAAATAPRLIVDLGFEPSPPSRSAGEGFCVMRPCGSPGGGRPVWRMAQALGFSIREPMVHPQAIRFDALDQPADVVVLDDAGLGFRRWPSRHAWPRFLREPREELPQWIVLKMSAPAATGDLWHAIVSEHTQPAGTGSPPPEPLGPIARRTVLLLSIDELRREFVRVDGRLSWERAAADLVQELDVNPALHTLKQVGFVVIRFGLDGALLLDQSGATEQRTLVFDPAGIEGAFLSGISGGTLFGYQSCLAAAVVIWLVNGPCGPATPRLPADRLVGAVKAGLSAMRRLALEGHHADQSATSFPHMEVAREICKPTSSWSFGSVVLPRHLQRASTWTIIASSEPHTPAPLWGLARRVALRGVEQLAGIPYVQFARLFSVDRSEIESLRTLQRLLASYRQDERASKPLSIAAFGPPGSGKSFGIKQLAEALFGDKNPLEFNLAQFSTPGELHDLFHQIRDRVLQRLKPIVFWDEFDSRDLFWLQYLLGPMQDGTFQDGQVTHPIGKCVFVFAGGTRHRFEDFGKPPASLLDAQGTQKWLDDFTMKKGPDFKSRLAGYINVLGPNRRDAEDITFPVRRALLLRVHLGLKPKDTAVIDPGLLDAFLRVAEYRHGARSLEKIAEQVRLSARAGAFNRSDLPPRQLIDLHVDADDFLSLVESA